MRVALSSLSRIKADASLSVNVGPQAIVSEQMQHLLASSQPGRLIVELTEEARVDDYAAVCRSPSRSFAGWACVSP